MEAKRLEEEEEEEEEVRSVSKSTKPWRATSYLAQTKPPYSSPSLLLPAAAAIFLLLTPVPLSAAVQLENL